MDERTLSQQVGSEPTLTAEGLTKGRVTVHRGRLFGTYQVTIKDGGRAFVSLGDGIQWCGTSHRGEISFLGRGASVEPGTRCFRIVDRVNDTPTLAARDALEEGALEALREWVRTRPLAWEAADCLAAGVAAEKAALEVESLRAQLAEAERELEAARADHEARVSALAMVGVL